MDMLSGGRWRWLPFEVFLSRVLPLSRVLDGACWMRGLSNKL